MLKIAEFLKVTKGAFPPLPHPHKTLEFSPASLPHTPPILAALWFVFPFHQVLVTWLLVNKGIFNELQDKAKETGAWPLVSPKRGKVTGLCNVTLSTVSLP